MRVRRRPSIRKGQNREEGRERESGRVMRMRNEKIGSGDNFQFNDPLRKSRMIDGTVPGA
jgi:hypothetical protein